MSVIEIDKGAYEKLAKRNLRLPEYDNETPIGIGRCPVKKQNNNLNNKMKLIFSIIAASIVIYNMVLGIVTFTGLEHWQWVIISSLAYLYIIKRTDIKY